MSKTAILIDGGFFRRRFLHLYGQHTASETAEALYRYCRRHLHERTVQHELYRIFYYDCPPADKQVYHPLLDKTVNLKTEDTYKWMTEFLNAMKRKRKVALRMGLLDTENTRYILRYEVVKKLCNQSLRVEDLTEKDFKLSIAQKGVDMKMGVDISTLSYCKLVDQIVIIGNDRDYIPAIKLARTNGIDVVLDTLAETITDDNPLTEHIDGLRSCGNPFQDNQEQLLPLPDRERRSP